MKSRRAWQWQRWLSRGCALFVASSACGRTELDPIAPAEAHAGNAGSPANGGQSSRGSSVLFAGGSPPTLGTSGGVRAAGGSVSCPKSVPSEGSNCTSSLVCAYITAEKVCCQEAASAACKEGHWTVAYTDCDCTGGKGSVGGAAGTGGSVGSGGLAPNGGRSATAGAFGCRGDPIGYVAPSCDLLIPAEPPLVRLEGAVSASQDNMGLARATDDGRCVSVVTSQPGSGDNPRELRALSFEPWSNWPKAGSFGPLKTIPLPDTPAGAFAIGPSIDHRIALAFQAASGETGFGWDLDPESFVGSYRFLRSPGPEMSISTSRIGEVLASRVNQRQSMRVWSHDDTANTLFRSACADTSTSLGVEPYQRGFVWAVSNGSNNTEGGCSYSTPTPGAATRIEIGQITDVCCSHSIWNFEFGNTITALKTAPHPNGIWVVWQAESSGTKLFRWMRIGFEPGIVLGPASVDLDGDDSHEFAVTAIGRKLAVAWRNESAEHRLALALINEDGRVSRNDPPVQALDLRQLTMVSGPAGAGALIGFPDGSLMRLDCAEWE